MFLLKRDLRCQKELNRITFVEMVILFTDFVSFSKWYLHQMLLLKFGNFVFTQKHGTSVKDFSCTLCDYTFKYVVIYSFDPRLFLYLTLYISAAFCILFSPRVMHYINRYLKKEFRHLECRNCIKLFSIWQMGPVELWV